MSQPLVRAMGEATSLADRKRRAGQRLLIGIAGPAINDDERLLIEELRPFGYVLFERNLVEPSQVLDLCRELRDAGEASHPPIVAVDQEGGPVQRLRVVGATDWPSASVVARTTHTAAMYRGIAREMRAMGLDMNLAPVADITPRDANLQPRHFGQDPQLVATHVRAAVDALQTAHIMAVVKHFPGMGSADADPHQRLPSIELDRPELCERDLRPFRAALDAGAFMTAHACYPAYDETQPATLSSSTLTALRQVIGHRGLVMTDDLEMQAIREHWSTEQIVRKTTAAGVDVLMVAHTLERQYETYRALVLDQELDVGHHRAARDAARRVHLLRERFLLGRPHPPPLDEVGNLEHRILATRIRHEGGA